MQRLLKTQGRLGAQWARTTGSLPTTNTRSFALRTLSSSYRATAVTQLPMKPGHVFEGLDFYKDQDPPAVMERSEYPEWLADLAKPLPTLAELRRMPEEEATDRDIMRYLKLERKIVIKQKNEESKGRKRRH